MDLITVLGGTVSRFRNKTANMSVSNGCRPLFKTSTCRIDRINVEILLIVD